MREFRPGSFQILPLIIKNLIIINVLVFIAQQPAAYSNTITDLFALHTWQSPLFKPWQFITHLFLHANFWHIAFNMFALWSFGSVLENLWGPKRFLTFYLICGLGAALSHMTVLYIGAQHLVDSFNTLKDHFTVDNFTAFYTAEHIGNYYSGADAILNQWQSNPGNFSAAQQAFSLASQFVNDHLNEPTIGASGAVFGCLAAFGYLFPNALLVGFPFFIPIKAKWIIGAYILIELYSSFVNSAGDNIAHVAHLGGALFGFILVIFWNRNNRRTFY